MGPGRAAHARRLQGHERVAHAQSPFHECCGLDDARGRAAQKGGSEAQGLGRSKGGRTTKLHAACDALGTPLKLIHSPGHRDDVLYAADLIEGFRPDYVIADRACDGGHFLDAIYEAGANPVIPPRRNRRHPHPCDWALYKERNMTRRLFNKLKPFRRVATRYDKLLDNFLGFFTLAAISLLLG